MAYHPGMFEEIKVFSDADSNGGADTELVAAVAGTVIVVDEIMFTASAACAVFLESGASTVVFPTVYLAAGDNFVMDSGNLCRTAVSEALTYTAVVTGNVSIWIKYHRVTSA